MFYNVKRPTETQALASTQDASETAPMCPICDARLMAFVTVLGELEVWQCRPCGATLLIPNRTAALGQAAQSH
jgi:hypothetical protein